MLRVCLLLFALVVAIHGARKIYDPLNLFCGPDSCYDILGVKKSATPRQLKKAYRSKSSQYHPDKYKEKNATVIFQKIAKAFEVLENNKTRELFDYYLKNPTDYFKGAPYAISCDALSFPNPPLPLHAHPRTTHNTKHTQPLRARSTTTAPCPGRPSGPSSPSPSRPSRPSCTWRRARATPARCASSRTRWARACRSKTVETDRP